jgi:predicted amidohydrolase YtcJ
MRFGPARYSAVVLFAVLCIFVVGTATVVAQDAPAPPAPVHARTIFRNGKIVTVDRAHPEAQALAVAPDGTILAVGDLQVVMDTQDPNGSTTVVDLDGKTLMPGFVEPHTHAVMTAFNTHMKTVPVPPAEPADIVTDLSSFNAKWPKISQIKNKLRAALKDVPAGGWLVAFGVDPSRTSPFMAELDATALDDVSEDVPIFIVNQSGHFAYVNHKAFVLAGVTTDSNQPAHGRYLKKKNANGEEALTGVLAEAPAYQPFLAVIELSPTGQAMTTAARLAALRTTYQCFAESGVTTASEMSLGLVTGSVTKELKLLETLASEGPPVRIRAYVSALVTSPDKLTLKPNQGDDLLRIIGIKFVEDGSTQGLSAALNAPYSYPKDTDNTGESNYSSEELYAAASKYAKAGWQLAMHSNGNESTRRVLNVYARLLDVDATVVPRAGDQQRRAALRWRIEHFTVVDKKQIDTVWNLGLSPSMTNGHVYYWGYSFDEENILGSSRARSIDPARWLLNRKIRFAFNSDAPITPAAPLRYISTAVTRNYQRGTTPLGAKQRIPIDAAIRAVTIDAAYQLFLDDKVGSLEVGKWADLVVLDQNPMTADGKDIMDIKVLETYLSGVRKYTAPTAPVVSPCAPGGDATTKTASR